MNITNICIIGLSNCGKTTLLNKIIGKNILPIKKTKVNLYIENSFDANSEDILKNLEEANNPYDIINIKTNIEGLYEANKRTTKFYDTICLELEVSENGKIVKNITQNCDFIIYVLNFKDIIRKQIFKHYEILNRDNKKVVLVVTNIDKFIHNNLFNTKEKIKNYVYEKYKENNLKLNLCEIIPVNLLDDSKDNFSEIINIANKTKKDVENIILRKKLKDLENYRDGEIFGKFMSAGIDILGSIFRH